MLEQDPNTSAPDEHQDTSYQPSSPSPSLNSTSDESQTSGEYFIPENRPQPLEEHRSERNSTTYRSFNLPSPTYSSTDEETPVANPQSFTGLATSPLQNQQQVTGPQTQIQDRRQQANYVDDIIWFGIRNRGQENGRPQHRDNTEH